MFTKKVLILTILPTFNAPILFAQDNNEITELDKKLEIITVTATRSTVPKSAIPNTDKEDFAREIQFSGSTVEAISSLIPSFSPTREKLSGSGETLRGRNPLFLIDGVPQANPIRDGSRDGYTVDPFFIDSVEVVFGANAIQGVGATGGVINYKTASAPKEEGIWTGKILAQLSTGNEFQGDSNGYRLAGLIGKDFGDFDLTIGVASQSRGAYYSGDGRLVGVATGQGEVQDSESKSFYLKSGLDISSHQRFEIMAQNFKLEGNNDYISVAGSRATNTPSTAEKGETLGRNLTNDVTTISATYTNTDFAGGSLIGQLFYQDFESLFGGGVDDFYQDPAIDPTGMLLDQSANQSTKNGARVSFERKIEYIQGFRFVAGLDYLSDEAAQVLIFTGRKWVPEIEFSSVAPFLQLHQEVFDKRVHISAGIRNESAEIEVGDYTTIYPYGAMEVAGGNPDFNETLINLGITFEVIDGLTLYSSYAEGFTMPDVGRILRAVSVPNIDVDNLIDLKPVVSDNLEIGMDWTLDNWELSAAYYNSDSKNGSSLVLVGDTYEVKRQATEVDGIELNATWFAPVEGLKLSMGYSTADGRVDNSGNGKLDSDFDGANISPDRVNVTIDYAADNYSLQLRSRTYLARDFDGEENDISFDGHTLIDAFFNYETSIGDIYISASNLLDKQYVSYDSQTVRVTRDDRFFAGRGRSVNLGLKWAF